MSTKETLIAAKALIDTPEKWIKKSFNINGCYCAVGALEKAEELRTGNFHHYRELDGEWLSLWNALPEASKSGTDPMPGDIFIYNDDFATHADIMALFDRAIANAD